MSADSPSPGLLHLQALFPLALAQVQLPIDPLEVAMQMQAIRRLKGGARSNPSADCAWTGDLHGTWQLHRHPDFAALLDLLLGQAWAFVQELGFDPSQVALHLQRCWPVVSEPGQAVGRHHHPNAHLSGVYYLNGDGSGRTGCLRLFPPRQSNELVPGLAVGHGGPLGGERAERWNAPWFDLAPRAGLLVLFPASVDHAVLENPDPQESRFSISFDLVLTSAPARGGESPEYLAPHPADWQAVER